MLVKVKLKIGTYTYINPLYVGAVGENYKGETCICVLGDKEAYVVYGTVDEIATRINNALEEMR